MSIIKRKNITGKKLWNAMREDEMINIKPYAPHQSLSAVPYMEPQAMADLKLNFKTKVAEFLDKTNPDQYNSTFIDTIVDRTRAQALRELEVQRIEHTRAIERSISSLWKGDLHLYERLIVDYDEEYENRLKELRRLKRIYNKGTSYEEFDMEV